MLSAMSGRDFSRALNLRLTCSLSLPILLPIIPKSVPYSLSKVMRVAIYWRVQVADFLLPPIRCFFTLLPKAPLSPNSIYSMAVEMVDTGDSMLELPWECQSSTVKQKTLPTEPQPHEAGRLIHNCHPA